MTARTPRTCVACEGLHRVDAFTATERLLGTLEQFEYWECPHCGCVQITRVPEDLARHYPARYFAFKPQHRLAANRLRGLVDPARLDAALGRGTLPARLANRLLKPLDYAAWCEITGLGRGARVLDIGCGSGKLLVRLRHAGFSRCLGVDPFVHESLHYANGAEVRRQSVFELAAGSEERFDLVMAHHSLEHMTRPHEVLAAAASLLAPGGWMLLRVPVAGGHAWRHYREHWFALDPPRHLFLPTPASMRHLAARAGLRVEAIRFDSTLQQFALSELYRRGISLDSPHLERGVFARRQLARWRAQAAALNAAGDGDQAAFFLRRA